MNTSILIPEQQRPRRNSLNSLDPREIKRRRRMAVAVTVDDDDGPDSPKNLLQHLSLVSTVQIPDKIKRLLHLLGKHPLFSRISGDCLKRIFAEFVLVEYNRGDKVFKAEDGDDKFYVIEKGFCCVEGDDPSAQSGIGACFGDLSLVQANYKKVSLVALCEVAVWSIDGGTFRYMVSAHQQSRYEILKNFIEAHSKRLALHLPKDVGYVIDASSLLEFKHSDDVMTSASLPPAETIYFVLEGEVELIAAPPGVDPIHRIIYRGGCFGETFLAPEFVPGQYQALCRTEVCMIVATRNSVYQRLPHLRNALYGMATNP